MSKSSKQKPSTPLLLPAPSSALSRLFPHYTRLFAATTFPRGIRRVVGAFLWVFLIGTIGVNVLAAQNAGNLKISIPFVSKSEVLGESAPQASPFATDTDTMKKRYDYWEDVLRSNPDYRDAHYQAALIAYQLGKTEELKRHTEKVRELDPNFPGLSALEALISP